MNVRADACEEVFVATPDQRILDLVKKCGSANHEFYPSDRFENSIPNSNPTHIFNHNKSNRFYFINEKGKEEYLEAADDKV